jgi:hypothetical protein
MKIQVQMTHVRLTTYIVGVLGGGGFLLQALGVATYDAATGMIDLAPFSIYAVGGMLATVVASGLATIARWRNW